MMQQLGGLFDLINDIPDDYEPKEVSFKIMYF
jgi:hypothetical protein